MCKKCGNGTGVLIVLVGILYLLSDLGYIAWWTLNWWTIFFLIWGLKMWGMTNCKECCPTSKGSGKKK